MKTSQKYKILHIIFLSALGGASQVVYDIIKNLDEEKFSITLVYRIDKG